MSQNQQEMSPAVAAYMKKKLDQFTQKLIDGSIVIPQQGATQFVFAGGVSHCPNSDFSYSKAAAEVSGTLPGTAGDDNQECWRWFRVQQDQDISKGRPLRAVDHGSYAGDEGGDPQLPDWDRVNGWPRFGSTGTLYDLAAKLKSNVINASQKWYVLFKCAALDAAIVPADVQIYAGIWVKTASYEGWITGDNFVIEAEVKGVPGTNNSDYRVVAKTDSGLSMLSAIVNVPNAPDVLSGGANGNYVQVRFGSAGAGFIEFTTYRLRDGVYKELFTVRNTNDFQYNDIGDTRTEKPAEGWPAVSDTAPLAKAQTTSLRIAAVNLIWALNQMSFQVPPTFDFSTVVDMYLRIGISAPTGVDRHIAIDQIVLDTTYHEWSPDVMPPFSDGTYPIPTITPTSGNQGGSGGIQGPPGPGGGGGVIHDLPFEPYQP